MGGAEEVLELVRREHQRGGDMAVADDAASGFAGERGDLAIQLTDAGFAGVIVDDPAQGRVGNFDFILGQAVLFHLARHQVAFGDLKFLGLGVAGQFDDFEAVAQGGVDRLKPIGSGDEEDARQIEGQIQVMIGEGVVLSGIEHLEKGGRRVATEIRADLVQFIQQNYRIAALDAAQGLDDAPGQSADISAAMAANLGFVPHPAQ